MYGAGLECGVPTIDFCFTQLAFFKGCGKAQSFDSKLALVPYKVTRHRGTAVITAILKSTVNSSIQLS